MPAPDLLMAFFLAAAVFAYMPGPAILYTVAQTIARGRRAGWLAVAGIHLGGYVHVAAAALGLAVLFKAVPMLYASVKFAGAAYLISLGVSMILSKGTLADAATRSAPPPKRTFFESITVEVLNPKAAIFYLAFLPQFTDPTGSLPIWAQLFVLGTIVNLMFSSADALCVLLADKAARAVKNSRSAEKLVRRLGGTILVGLGANLALSRQ